MTVISKAYELVKEIEKELAKTKDEELVQALDDMLGQANYLATRLEELGSF